jgi:cytochrome c
MSNLISLLRREFANSLSTRLGQNERPLSAKFSQRTSRVVKPPENVQRRSVSARFRALASFSAFALAIVVTFAPLDAQVAVPKAAPMASDKLFGQQCGACHSTVAGETRAGPSLAGVVGRRAGSVAGYQYSAALKRSGILWNRANLDKWLSGSAKAVPGTNMSYAQADAAKREAIINYLLTLR